ncbi:MAG: hypothetical protein O3B09_03270 [Proteobacteria bacterium]|nr:hypothetical protein [Pseudomonadota bacterium]
MTNNQKKFVKSFAAGVFTVAMLSSCSLFKGKSDAHKCSGKNGCSGKKDERHSCSSNSCSSNSCKARK